MRDDQVSDTEVVELPVDADELGHVVGCFDADVSGMDVGVNEVDLEHRTEEMDYDRMIQHAIIVLARESNADLVRLTATPRYVALAASCPRLSMLVATSDTRLDTCCSTQATSNS